MIIIVIQQLKYPAIEMVDNMIKELIKIANELDVRGLTQEADLLDKIATDISKSASRIPREDQADWYGWGCNPAYRLNPLAESGWPCCWPPEDIPNENCKPWQMSEVEKKYWDSRKDLNMRRDIQAEIAGSDLLVALDWGTMGAAMVAEFIPVVGTGVARSLLIANIVLAIGRRTYLGAGFGVIALMTPMLGESIAILGKTIQMGAARVISRDVLRLLFMGLKQVTGPRLEKWVSENLDIKNESAGSVAANIMKELKDFTASLGEVLSEEEGGDSVT